MRVYLRPSKMVRKTTSPQRNFRIQYSGQLTLQNQTDKQLSVSMANKILSLLQTT